jgi:hypothetical protein
MRQQAVKIIQMFLIGSGAKFGTKVVFITILIVPILFTAAHFTTVHYQPEIMRSQSLSRYDLNGDGLVTEADIREYKAMFDRLNFNDDSQVDIFDQVELVRAVEDIHKVYLPVVTK